MKKMLFSLVAVVILVGCGGGGSSLPSMDNSKVSGAEETFTGYYAGNGVMFAGGNIVGSWTLYQLEPEYKSTGIRFYDDGDLWLVPNVLVGNAYQNLFTSTNPCIFSPIKFLSRCTFPKV